MGRFGFSLICAALIGCSTPETSRREAPDVSLPQMRVFSQVTPTAPQASNAQIARDYLDLVFKLENGTALPRLTRFEGSITVAFTGPVPEVAQRDLERLLGRLRKEARLPIRQVGRDAPASINLVPVSRAQIQRVAPNAACFVRPNVSSWDEFRKRRKDPQTFWAYLTSRTRMAIFLPNDVSPQEMRDCMHEEIAQALGPVNDLYRLNESIFNDDNFHSVLTGFDMLILRVHYDPAFRNGMSKAEVADRLPEVLHRLNARGRSAGNLYFPPDSKAWNATILSATAQNNSKNQRRGAARRAITLAQRPGSDEMSLAFSHYVYGRLTIGSDPQAALNSFQKALNIYRNRPDAAVQEAHVALQIAAFQLATDQAEDAISTIDRNLKTVRRAEHASLLTVMLLVKAEALELLKQSVEAKKTREEALAWGRYGFGNEKEIREREDEITAISPRSRQGGSA